MSGGTVCKCNERKEPLDTVSGSNRPGRLWRVTAYKCNYSKFNGSRYTSSDYSACKCLRCGSHWRTKAPYAGQLPAINMDEVSISSGYAGHDQAMRALGREPYNRNEEV